LSKRELPEIIKNGESVRELEFADKLAKSLPLPATTAAADAPSRSHEYWVLFNKAESDYQQGQYRTALDALSQLRDFGTPHQTALSLHLRCHRKIRDAFMKDGDWTKALEASTRLLCETLLDTTATDDRKHNGIVDALTRTESGWVPRRVEVRSAKRKPAAITEVVRVASDRGWSVCSTDLKKVPDKYETRWKHRVMMSSGTLEIAAWGLGRFGDPASKAVARVHPANGDEPTIYQLEHVAYRIGTHPVAQAFTTMSPDLEIAVYDLSGHRLGGYNIPCFGDLKSDEDKYKVRCVSASHNGTLHLYTSVHQATLLDDRWAKVWVVQTPAAPGYQKRIQKTEDDADVAARSALIDAVRVIGVSPSSSRAEIKRAYRSLAMRCHPDKNPGDELALERMKAINAAYEVLSGESATKAWDTEQEVEIYYRSIKQWSVDVGGVGRLNFEISMVGPGQDWIYAAAFNELGTMVYLGCYSGRIFILDLQSNVISTLHAHETVLSIVPLGTTLLIETTSRVLSLVSGEYRGHVATGTQCSITYFPGGFIVKDGRTLRVFDLLTNHLGDLVALDTIRSFWRVGLDLAIEMNKACARVSGVFRDLPSYQE
jgi:hypothetical protein